VRLGTGRALVSRTKVLERVTLTLHAALHSGCQRGDQVRCVGAPASGPLVHELERKDRVGDRAGSAVSGWESVRAFETFTFSLKPDTKYPVSVLAPCCALTTWKSPQPRKWPVLSTMATNQILPTLYWSTIPNSRSRDYPGFCWPM